MEVYFDSNRDKEFNRKNSKSFEKIISVGETSSEILIVDNKRVSRN